MPVNRLTSCVAEATTVDEVLEATRRYLDAMPAVDLVRIPLECRPTWIVDEDALLLWSDALTRRRSRSTEVGLPASEPLKATESFFSLAAFRIRQLRSQALSGVPSRVGDNRPHVA